MIPEWREWFHQSESESPGGDMSEKLRLVFLLSGRRKCAAKVLCPEMHDLDICLVHAYQGFGRQDPHNGRTVAGDQKYDS